MLKSFRSVSISFLIAELVRIGNIAEQCKQDSKMPTKPTPTRDDSGVWECSQNERNKIFNLSQQLGHKSLSHVNKVVFTFSMPSIKRVFQKLLHQNLKSMTTTRTQAPLPRFHGFFQWLPQNGCLKTIKLTLNLGR